MKKKTVKMFALLMVLSLIVSLFAACGGNNNEEPAAGQPKNNEKAADEGTADEGTTEPAGLDTSKRVELQFYMLGGAPADLPIIEDEINKMLIEDLNATVKFNFTTWTDWEQKYRLLLSSGQPVDLIFTAEWTKYQQYAKQGAFMALDDLLPVAAPQLLEYVPQDYWDAVRIDGDIQTVPNIWKEYVTQGVMFREDLRKKYNLPEINSIETYEAYLAGIKENEPDMTPLGHTADMGAYYNFALDEAPAHVTKHGLPHGLLIPYDDPTNVIKFYGSNEHLEHLKRMKTWMDNGYWSRNVLSITDAHTDLFQNGQTASFIGENPNRWNDSVLRIAASQPDWEVGYFGFPEMRGFATPVHPIHNGFAIPKSSENPERALAFFEKMLLDKRYNWLTQYGIEGTNFNVTDSGHYEMIGDADSNGFPRESMQGWAWRNPDFMLFDKSFDAVQAIFDEYDKMAKPDFFLGFAEDQTPYQAELAALEQVERQYLWPLNVGLVDDVEAGLATYMEKAKEAGIEKIQEEFTKQWLQYLEEQNIN